MKPYLDPIIFAIPLFLFSLVFEFLQIRKSKQNYNLVDARTSISMGLGNLALSLFFAPLIWAASTMVYDLRILTIPMTAMGYLALFIADDFIYYWFHRISHQSRIWWAAHVNHHSSEHYNLSTALRQHWTGNFVLNWALWLPLVWIGFDPRWVLMQKSVSLIYQYWIHTELIHKMPNWFERVFNTPSHHRVHHGSNTEYLDCNYAGILIVWDKLFKSFVSEDPKIQIRYGLTKNVGSYKILKVAFHEWQDIFRDLRKTQGMRSKIRVVFGKPG